MAEFTISNPELYETKRVDNSGKLYLGKDYAGKEVKILIEEVVETDGEE